MLGPATRLDFMPWYTRKATVIRRRDVEVGSTKPNLCRAASVLLYVAQLSLPPTGCKDIERGCLTKAFKMAPNSHSTCTAFSMSHWGGPRILRPSYCCAAARFRAAVKGLEGFREMHFELKRIALEAIPMKNFFEGGFSPPGWESPAFCTNLTNAYFGVLGPELISAYW